MLTRQAALALVLALGVAACGDQSTPTGLAPTDGAAFQEFQRGTGLVIDNVTGTPIPLVGDAVFSGEVVITELALNAVGGLVATGVLNGTVEALGIEVVDQEFTTELGISKTGSGGQCGLLTLNLAPIDLDVAGLAAVDLGAAEVSARAVGPIGPLLCNLTRVLNSAVGGAVNGLLNAINALLGGGGPPLPSTGA